MATLTFRIYKNELDENRLDDIRKRYQAHIAETEKVLTVEGEKEDILKLYENYLLSEARFKAAFPDYMTRAERAEYTLKKVEAVKSYVQNVTRIYFSRCDCGCICYPLKRKKLSISS